MLFYKNCVCVNIAIISAKNIKQYLYADIFLYSSRRETTMAVRRKIKKKSDLSERKFFIEWQSNWHNECNFIRSNTKDEEHCYQQWTINSERQCVTKSYKRKRKRKHEAESGKKTSKRKPGRSIAFVLLERRVDVIIYETSLTQTRNFASRVYARTRVNPSLH